MKIVAVLLPFTLMLGIVPLLAAMAPAVGLVDRPSARKRHLGVIPTIGGWSILIACALSTIALGPRSLVPIEIGIASFLITLIGSADDRWPLPSVARFGAQVLVIVWLVRSTGIVLSDVGHLVSPRTLELAAWAVPFTVFGMLGVVNAVNLSDGLDGLAAGMVLVACCAFLVAFGIMTSRASWPVGSYDPSMFVRCVLGGVAGFLVYNLRTPRRARASVFLGDAGSLLLGLTVAWLAVYACSRPAEVRLPPTSALWILLVPLFDTVACMFRRLLEGRSPMSADRRHAHHLLMAWGLTHGQTSICLIVVGAAAAAVGIAGWIARVPDHLMFWALMAAFAVYVGVSTIGWRRLSAGGLTGEASPDRLRSQET